jgi:Fe-S-cluster-containing dehydrogenase component/formate-dependent nitrite reductase membrane component NrfD
LRYSRFPVPTYGFAIDLKMCIGCHACTIACKAEHDIPVGVNRCWVKTVEKGTFPDTQRLFLPVLCNQCEEAPCMNICPTNALFRRPDGIVDLDGDACIGCKACMVACPYDQLFIDPNTKTAEKCNFCANRIENQLQPACVSVCPTECRIFGDLDDPTSRVAQIVQREAFTVRKPEKGTGPKIFYLDADASAMQPEIAARPFMYKEGQVHLRPLGSPEPDPAHPGDPRVDYDVPHRKPWGIDLVLYLLTKGISTGAMFLSALLWAMGDRSTLTGFAGPLIAAIFCALTALVLVLDLERPERFLYILQRPNWNSWMARGAFLLTAHGVIAGIWLLAWMLGWTGLIAVLVPFALLVALATTAYTGFLFAQGLARDLWQGPHATIDLMAQAVAEGSAMLLLAALFTTHEAATIRALGWTLAFASSLHLLILVIEHLIVPSPTLHHELAVRAIREGPYKQLFWIGALGLGGAAPLVLVVLSASIGFPLPALAFTALVALAGGLAWEYVWVEAGQSVPLS